MKLIMNLMLGVMALILAVAVLPVVDDLITDERSSDGWNCANAPDYNASMYENKLTCVVTSITTGFVLIAVVMGVFAMIMYGKREDDQPYDPRQY